MEELEGDSDFLYFLFFFLNFSFCLGVWPINNVVMVSGGQQRDSVIHIHVSILSQTPLPSRLPHHTEQSFIQSVLAGYPF